MPNIIIVDAGHGGRTNDGGSDWNHASGPSGLLEKAVTLSASLAAIESLRQHHHDARATREQDVNLSLAARAAVANNAQARVFVSIHFNGDTNSNVQGTETWLHTIHSPDSGLLANSVQAHVRNATGYRDRGLKKGGLGVLDPARHYPGTACCLAEISFMTNPQDDLRLQNNAYITQLGRAIAQGITDFLNGASTQPSPVSAYPVPVPGGDI